MEVRCEDMQWNQLAQDKDNLRTIVKFSVPYKAEYSLASSTTIIFSRRTLFLGVTYIVDL
jgi:hypothetical protein